MKAGEVKFRELLAGNIQYRVPLFQRPYAWRLEQWEKLWSDIEELYEADLSSTHFIGAIVTLPMPDAPERSAKFMLIDGQQRLTTLLILLAVLKRFAETAQDKFLVQQIQQTYLENVSRHQDELFKIMPTKQDADQFDCLMRNEPMSSSSGVAQAAAYFTNRISERTSDNTPFDLCNGPQNLDTKVNEVR